MKNLLLKKVHQVIFFIFLLSSCSTQVDRKRNEKLKAFFEELLLEHGGAYTLFGQKPITIEELVDTSEEASLGMQDYLAQHPELDAVQCDRELEEGWREWKQLTKKPISSNYILTEIHYSDYDLLVFVNVNNTLSAINEYQDLFEKVANTSIDPERLIQELRNGEHRIWKKFFQNYTLMGILFGYGYENAALFEKKINGEKLISDGPSENNDPRLVAECYLNGRPFRIPIFSMLDRRKQGFGKTL